MDNIKTMPLEEFAKMIGIDLSITNKKLKHKFINNVCVNCGLIRRTRIIKIKKYNKSKTRYTYDKVTWYDVKPECVEY